MATDNEPPAKNEAATDVGSQRVASIYAEALMNVAEKHGEVDSILKELESLTTDVFGADSQLETFLSSGAIGRHRKAELVEKTFANRASDILLNFLLVLNEHDRLGLVRAVLAAYRKLRDKRARRIRVQVTSATPLAEDQQQKLRQELAEAFKLEPTLEMEVDPELLGGMVVRVGDWLFDGSVKSRLENIRNQIIERSSHEIQSGRDRFSSAGGN